MVVSETERDEVTTALRALADPVRRQLVEELRRREECVTVLAEHVGITTALASHHLRVLEESGFAQVCQKGHWRCYSLIPGRLAWLRRNLAELLDPALPVDALSGSNPCGGGC